MRLILTENLENANQSFYLFLCLLIFMRNFFTRRLNLCWTSKPWEKKQIYVLSSFGRILMLFWCKKKQFTLSSWNDQLSHWLSNFDYVNCEWKYLKSLSEVVSLHARHKLASRGRRPKNLEQFFKKSFKSLPWPYRCRELERKHKDPL